MVRTRAAKATCVLVVRASYSSTGVDMNASDRTQSLIESQTECVAAIPKKIWIDLDNSPHVPFFAPILRELERRGYPVALTARDCFQVCELAKIYGLSFKVVGRHYGKNRLLKAIGLSLRALELIPTSQREKPALSLSHGSRAQVMASTVRRIPSVVILDYEYAEFLPFFKPTWVIVPEVIPDSAVQIDKSHILRYPGIKEDVYVPTFKPNADILGELRLDSKNIIVTVRPPANEAHYYNPESDQLFRVAMDVLLQIQNTQVILLPRNDTQASSVRRSWPEACSSGKIIIPEHAVDGLNLIWHSDLVISGGGTMNREAAALRVPVYSVFRGRIGAVDRYLADVGRLVLLESAADVRTKLIVKRYDRPMQNQIGPSNALNRIVDHVTAIADSECREVERRH